MDNTSQTGAAITGALWTGAGGVVSGGGGGGYTGDFTVAVSPSSKTAAAIRILDYALTLAGDFTGPVRLSVDGLQPGMLCLFDTDPVSIPTALYAHIYVDPSTPLGTYSIAFRGSGTVGVRSAAATLIVASSGGGPGPAVGSIRVLIDGMDRTDYLSETTTPTWNLMRMNRGSSSLPFEIPPGDTFAPQIGQLIEIWDAGQRVWAGTADTVEVRWQGDDGWHLTTVTGVTLESLFDSVQLDKRQFATTADVPLTAGAMVTQLFTDAAIPIIGLGIISDGPIVQALSVISVKQALDTLSTIADFIWYVDPRDMLLYFHAAGLRAADWTLGDQTMLFESITWKQSRQDFADVQVMQLPGVATASQSTTFAGDGTTKTFSLPLIPQFVSAMVVEPTGSGIIGAPLPFATAWVPGTNKITCSPALSTDQSLVVTWLDAGQVVISQPAYGATVGHRMRRFTLTQSFTREGVIQQGAAALARYALLPSEFSFQTDRPGLTIGRALPVIVSYPTEANGLLNGTWQIVEVGASVMPGLEQRPEPFGHFRYTIYCVNFKATAQFQGDGSTTSFALPETPAAVGTPVVQNSPFPIGGYSAVWNPGTPLIDVSPAPPLGSTLTVPYQGATTPDTQPFTNTFEGMTNVNDPPAANAATADDDPPELFTRTLTLRDLTVGNDIAPHTCAWHAGIGTRVLMVTRLDLTADLVVRLNKSDDTGTIVEMIEVTIPAHTASNVVLEVPLQQGSPATAVPVLDKDVFTADILASDGQTDANGVAQITCEWEYDY